MISERKTMSKQTTNQSVPVALSGLLAMLQPSDSSRVADALIAKIEQADFNLAAATKDAVETCLLEDMRRGLGEEIVSSIGEAVRYSVELCVGSPEMGRIVANAISDGIQASAENRSE